MNRNEQEEKADGPLQGKRIDLLASRLSVSSETGGAPSPPTADVYLGCTCHYRFETKSSTLRYLLVIVQRNLLSIVRGEISALCIIKKSGKISVFKSIETERRINFESPESMRNHVGCVTSWNTKYR